MRTIEKHAAAIQAGEITKTNVIGIRKAINTAERRRRGYSVSSTSPAVTLDEVQAIERALYEREPRVAGDLHASGVAVLRNPRWRNRWNEAQAAIIDRLDHFKLVGFERLRADAITPVYRAVSTTGQSFLFRNVPWQTADALGEESGPRVVLL